MPRDKEKNFMFLQKYPSPAKASLKSGKFWYMNSFTGNNLLNGLNVTE